MVILLDDFMLAWACFLSLKNTRDTCSCFLG